MIDTKSKHQEIAAVSAIASLKALPSVAFRSSSSCWICGRAISLESCNTDEYGNAVHEVCYVARVQLNMKR